MVKYIKLYEEYSQDIKTQTEETSHTWTDIRDTVQFRLPFTIIVFKNKESYQEALDTDLKEFDYIKQSAAMSRNGDLIDYPSVFIILQDDTFKDKIPQLFEKFKIKTLILGKKGEEYSDFYYNGASSPAGNEIVSSNSLDDMENDDHFKIGSTYYKFTDVPD